MATTVGFVHMPALGEHERTEIGNELQATLVELISLSLLGKQLHWSVVGANFRPLHLYLDELVEDWQESVDVVAERTVAVGCWPDGQPTTVAMDSHLVGVEPGALDDHVVARELTQRLAEVSERTRERLERLAELDVVSEDVLVGVVRQLEEQLWMVRSQASQRA